MSIGTSASGIPSEQLSYVSRAMKAAWAMNQQASKATPDMVRALVAASDVAAVVVSDMQKAGVGILAGCDGMVPGFCVHGELALMVRGGMSPLAALRTATINPARYLRREESLGTVVRSKIADLIVLDGSPLDDIGNVRSVRAVVRAGRLLKRPELNAMLAKAKSQPQRSARCTLSGFLVSITTRQAA